MSKGKELGNSKVLNIALSFYLLIGMVLVYLYTLSIGAFLSELGFFYLVPGLLFIIVALVGLGITSRPKKRLIFISLSVVLVLYMIFILFFSAKV